MKNKRDSQVEAGKAVQKRVPKLRFPEFQDAPEWEEKRLGEIFSERVVKNHSEMPVLAATQDKGVIPCDLLKRSIIREDKNLQGYKLVMSGDFVISLRSFEGGFEYSNIDGIISPAYTILSSIQKIVNTFFSYYFKRTDFISLIKHALNNSLRDGKSINYKQAVKLRLVTPLFAEQQKIADCLTSIDELISTQIQKLEKLKAYKKGLLQQLFPAEGETVPKLRFPEFQDAPEWEEKRLGEIADIIASGDLNISLFSPISSQEYIVPVFTNAVENEGLYGYYSVSKYSKNSITITARGSLGIAFVRKKDFMGVGRLIIVTNFNGFNSIFLKECWNYLAKIPNEVTSIPQLTAVTAKGVKLPFPPLPEQQKIADCLTSIDELIDTQSRRLEKLKAYKKGLLQQLFSESEGAEE